MTRIGNDRLIATARVIVSGLLLAAIWLDPTQPAILWEIAYTLLGLYLCLSLVAAALEYQRAWAIPKFAAPLLHGIDIIFITALVYFTQGTTRSVFGFFVYLVVVSHVRWRWTGTLVTSVLVLLSYFLVMLAVPPVSGQFSDGEGTTDADGIVVRIGYLVVVAAILIYIGQAQERATAKMLIAAEWPTVMNPADALPAFLEHAGEILGATQLVLLWLPEHETRVEATFYDRGALRARRWPRDAIEARIERDAGALLFHWQERGRRIVTVSDGVWRFAQRPPMPERLLKVFGVEAILGIWFQSHFGYGCVLCPRRALEPDDLILAQTIADRFRSWGDQNELYRQLEEGKFREHQIRLARDLHDTVLQTLAGTSLQLQSMSPQLADSQPQIATRIDRLVEMLGREQATLRSRLHALVADVPGEASAPVALDRRLAELGRQVEAHWEMSTVCSVDPPHGVVSSVLDRELTHVLLEAAANAKKHSQAERFTVKVAIRAAEVELAVANDQPNRAAAAQPVPFDPKMLRRRVEHLGGRLRVEVNPGDVRLHIVLPRGLPADA